MGCLNSVDENKYTNKKQLLVIGLKKVIKQNLIAEGAYGSVWKCFQPITNQIFALKIIHLQTTQLREMYEKQTRLLTKMKRLNSKNVVKLIQSSIQTQSKDKHADQQIGYILMEFSHMSLYEQIKNRRFQVEQIATILQQILNGIQQLHSISIFHLDIKPENIILCDNIYKICDLGSCIESSVDYKTLDRKQKLKIQQFIEANSTLMYRSPEMVDLTGKILNQKSDIWMVGLIGYLMLYRKHPFQNKGKTAILSPIQFPTQGKIQQLLKKMLRIDTNQRITLVETKQFLKQIK